MTVDRSASPESVLLAALAARDAWDYERVAALADPASAAERFGRYREAVRPKTLDDFRGYHPDIPEQWLAAAFEKWRAAVGDPESRIGRAVPGVRSYDELIALSPAEFLARWMAADDPRAELVARLRGRGRAVPPGLLGTAPGVTYAVLGAVHEPPDQAHVLYRERFERDGAPPVMGEVEIESLRRQQPDGEWRLIATGHFFLRPRGGTAWVLDEEFADLWGEDPP